MLATRIFQGPGRVAAMALGLGLGAALADPVPQSLPQPLPVPLPMPTADFSLKAKLLHGGLVDLSHSGGRMRVEVTRPNVPGTMIGIIDLKASRMVMMTPNLPKMALACKPALLIADEPTTALDVTIQAQILQLIRQLQEEMHMGVVFITHDMGVVAEVADRVLVMYRGDKVEEGAAERVFAAPEHSYTRALLSAVPRLGAMTGTGTKVGQAQVAGMSCDLWQVNGPAQRKVRAPTVACITADGIALRTETEIKGEKRALYEVQSVDLAPQDPTRFQLPPGLQVIKVPKGKLGALLNLPAMGSPTTPVTTPAPAAPR